MNAPYEYSSNSDKSMRNHPTDFSEVIDSMESAAQLEEDIFYTQISPTMYRVRIS